jgi:hypothetical protein
MRTEQSGRHGSLLCCCGNVLWRCKHVGGGLAPAAVRGRLCYIDPKSSAAGRISLITGQSKVQATPSLCLHSAAGLLPCVRKQRTLN